MFSCPALWTGVHSGDSISVYPPFSLSRQVRDTVTDYTVRLGLGIGIKMKDYGTVIVTLADEDKEEALPLVRRFYRLGFNIEATEGTAAFLKRHGIRTRVRRKLSDGSNEILNSIQAGYVSYILNTRAITSGLHYDDGVAIRRCSVQNGVTMFTSLDTARILLDVLEETIPEISTINK